MKKNSLLFLPLITGLFVLLEVTPSLAIVNSVTPSTNDTNRTNGWAHVDVTPGVGSATVDFISTRTFWSCFEYRIDNEPNTVVGANPNPEITDGRWTQVCVNNSHSTKFLSANEFIDVRMVYGAETDERFDWTRFDVISPISTPTILGFLSPSLSCNSLTNSHSIIVDWSDSSGGAGGLSGYEYNIEYPKLGGGIGIWNAYFTNSQYAGSLNEGTHTIKVRARDMLGNVSAWSNSCNISSDWTAPDVEINNPAEGYVSGVVDIRGTVTDLHPHHYWLAIYSGNTKVAGPGTVNRFDSFTNESLMMWDTSLVPDGVYTIRLEARDAANNKDSGSVDWHEVTVDNDSDNDGVLNINDYCPNSSSDETFLDLGINRHVWYGGENLRTLVNKRGVAIEQDSQFSIVDTHGCSCEQILDRLVLTTDESFGGHYKFGCSKGIIEDWIDGKYWIEKVTIPAINSEETLSKHNLLSGETYLLRASGTADAGDGIEFDAKYSFRTPTSTIWTDAVSTYESYGTSLLDLLVNGTTPWTTYNDTHIYESEIVGDGSPVGLKIYDVYYPNNLGNLYVDIFVELY